MHWWTWLLAGLALGAVLGTLWYGDPEHEDD